MIEGSVTPIRIPRHSIAVTVSSVESVECFVVLEYRVFRLPRPDSCGNSTKSTRIIFSVDVLRSINRDVVFHERTQCVENSDSVTTSTLHVVSTNYHVRLTIPSNCFVRQLRGVKFLCVSGVAYTDTPARDVLDSVIDNLNIIKPCNSSGTLVLRLMCNHVDTSVGHVLVVDVAVHIMHIELLEDHVINSSDILSNHRNTSTIHCILVLEDRVLIILPLIRNLKLGDFDILDILEQYRGRYITLLLVARII
ncbi:Uncharacterised protein [Chlamydia trachomatis]|nr:Uncharacterised protein [Chlamydia trachomatis]